MREGGKTSSVNVVALPVKGVSSLENQESEKDKDSVIDTLKEVVKEAVDQSFWKSTCLKDTEALEDEDAFRRRFGFSGNRSRRRLIIDFKHRKDLTDGEIRLLHWTGSLIYPNGEVLIASHISMVILGFAIILQITLMMMLALLASIAKNAPSWEQGINFLAVELLLVVAAFMALNFFIQPWVIKRRTDTVSE